MEEATIVRLFGQIEAAKARADTQGIGHNADPEERARLHREFLGAVGCNEGTPNTSRTINISNADPTAVGGGLNARVETFDAAGEPCSFADAKVFKTIFGSARLPGVEIVETCRSDELNLPLFDRTMAVLLSAYDRTLNPHLDVLANQIRARQR